MTTVPHSFLVVPITQIELGIVARLKTGLGKMVKGVAPYRGELDKINAILPALPAAWVSFGGARLDTHSRQVKWDIEYVVMVGARNPRNEAAARIGGPAVGEVGVTMLIDSVVLLVTNQKLDLAISPIKAMKVETLFNTGIAEAGDMAIYGIHFSTTWYQGLLEDGAWPQPLPGESSHLFVEYNGKTDDTPDAEKSFP